MRTKDAIYQRRAVRSYTDEVVSETTIHLLLEAAVQAPSAVNLQPWAFVVIQDRKLLKHLSERSIEMVKDRPIAAGFRKLFDNGSFNIFYNAGTLIVICAKPDGEHPDWDCCMAGENLMLAARDLGLGTCVVGFAWPALQDPEIKRQLGIPEAYQAVLPIIIGSPREFPAAPARRPPEILAWTTSHKGQAVLV